ncbi:prepilin-type N-terminal cleavage/methylation domain-containing protein [Thalassotalea psychrophila]|uniref:Prepilin-type N-terminal cleavage/methylation domain-containing protein n=1 Tax=Thalassotalea psychrophila TaxID=3065647 RepID=A0ABY9TWL7_9GAMM|nr:prepilin-type N-terminal cleavage/methylation domain-containing protein [Colwelliaceae bacterium SQ149]
MVVNFKSYKFQQGFTLIELVLGMTVIVVVIGFMMAAMLPKEKESADQIHLIRAAELGQSLMNEITSKAFDQNSDLSGGLLRCNETGFQACTTSANLGSEGETRTFYNDVDDFNGLSSIEDALGSDISELYNNFSIFVSVNYDNNYDGITDIYDGTIDNSQLTKRITITVTTPLGTPITFAVFKANFE